MRKNTTVNKMLRFYFAIISLIAAGIAHIDAATSHETDITADTLTATAHIKLDSAYIDLGTIPPDTIVETTMRFVNTGTAPLTIIRIFPECGCTGVKFTHTPVEPGDSGEIRVKFNSKGRRKGSFRKSMRIRSNGDNPRVVLAVKGFVKPRESGAE